MGFFKDMFKSIAKMGPFGLERPRDALRALESIIHSNRDDDEKVKHAKPILMWLKRVSLTGDREANEVLKQVRDRYRNFLDNNYINV